MKFSLHPYVQVAIFIVLITGIFLTPNLFFLFAGYLIVLFLLLASRQIHLHIKMLLIANLPFLIMLIFVYVIILKNHVPTSDLTGLNYSFMLFLRVTIMTSLFQQILNVPAEQLLFFFRKLRVNKSLLIVIVSSFTIWKDFISKGDRIVTARLARGFLKNRSIANRIKQVPFIIKPLLAVTLISSLERAASWKQRKLLLKIIEIDSNILRRVNYSLSFNIVILAIVSFWLFMIILNV